jgi:transposase
MFLRSTLRRKNGKEHRYWSIVENKRCSGGRIVQKALLYLGEINDQQEAAWQKTIDVFEHGRSLPRTVALFPAERPVQINEADVVRIKLSEMELHQPRQWGACWLFCETYSQLGLDQFWKERLPESRKGTRWDLILQTLCAYRLIDPGSEWRLHRQWFEQSAMADLLGEDFRLAEIHKLYECHDFVLEHKNALFNHLTQRWKDLFNTKFEVLLYDLTSTYFESEPPFGPEDKRKFGYSRDKRPDCPQVIIALIVTPEGFPLAYEVLSGNTSDRTTLKGFLKKIEAQYGKAQRIWVMDRGIPTEETLEQMRQSDPPVLYLVGTPKGRLGKLEEKLTKLSWEQARAGVEVKILSEEKEVYVLAKSLDRVNKERAMRRRQLKGLWKRLKELALMDLKRDALLMKLGAARQQAPAAWRLVKIQVPKKESKFSFSLKKDKLRQVRLREGRYLLRSNMPERAPKELWEFYLQLVQVEQAFKQLKGDLAIRPIFHQKQERIEGHIFVAFMAYCLQVTLGRRLKDLAPGLTARAVIEKMAAIQMIDVHLPTTDGRKVILTRYTHPEADQQMLIEKLKLVLPAQPPPKITMSEVAIEAVVVKT